MLDTVRSPMRSAAHASSVSIAVSAATAENERAQYQICRDLFDAWYRAVYLSAHGNVAIESVGWVTEKKERRYGATIRAVCTK